MFHNKISTSFPASFSFFRTSLIILGATVAVVTASATGATTAATTTSPSISDFELWPVVDCGNLVAGQTDEAADQGIAQALLTRGFFFCKNLFRGDEDTIPNVYQASRRAHAMPLSEKLLYAGRGYTGPDVQVEELAYQANKKSTVMAWDYTTEKVKTTPNSIDKNHYPAELATTLEDLYDKQAVIAKALLGSMARALGLPSDAFSQYTNGELGSVRLLRYPAVPPEQLRQEDLAGVSAHTDFEAFTLMHQDAPGLQVRARNSKLWEDAPVMKYNDGNSDAFLVIVGDVLERMTNGALQATPHRVLPTAHERYAIIRFNAFRADAVIAPLPAFCNETHPAAYSAVTMGEIMRVTIDNLEAGKGAWDEEADRSTTANYDYSSSSQTTMEEL